jgi:hypothetical protein
MLKGTLGIAFLAALQPMVNQAMCQPNCDIIKIAEDYIGTRYPFIDLAERHPVTSVADTVWQVAFELPKGALGFVPIVNIDRKTCMVVSAQVEQ